VKWYRNGVAVNVNDSNKYEINPKLPEKLTISELTEGLDGEYKCNFSNRVGSAASTGKVILASKLLDITEVDLA